MVDYSKTTGNQNVDAGLGCGLGLLILGFFIWIFFFREPDPDWTRKVAAETERRQELEQTRLNNARYACNNGLESACVEYAEMVD